MIWTVTKMYERVYRRGFAVQCIEFTSEEDCPISGLLEDYPGAMLDDLYIMDSRGTLTPYSPKIIIEVEL